MEYYSAIENNVFMTFLDKWIGLENIILSKETQLQKNTQGMHLLISEYYSKSSEYPTYRPHEAQEEGRPKCRYFDSYWKVDQNTHGFQPTNRMSLRSPMKQLEKGPK